MVRRLEGIGREPQLAWFPDGEHIVTGGEQGTVRVWTRDGELVRELPTGCGKVSSVAVSQSGQRILAVAATGRIGRALLWTAEGELLAEFTSGDHGVVRFSSDRTRLLFWERNPYDRFADCRVLLADAESGDPLAMLAGHSRNPESPTSNWISWATFSPDESVVLTAMWNDDRARSWSSRTGEHLATLGGHGANVRCPTFSSDGTLVVTCGGDHVKVWNVPRQALAH